MTTSPAQGQVGLRRMAGGLALAALGWAGVVAVGPVLGLSSPALRAIGAPPGLAASLPQGVALVEAGQTGLVLRGADPRDLYALGARLVLPAGLPACVPGAAGG